VRDGSLFDDAFNCPIAQNCVTHSLSGVDPEEMVTFFPITEAAKARPSNEGDTGTRYPGKRFWILILLSAIPWAFKFLGQDIGQVSRSRFGKFTSIFKKLFIFQRSDRFT